MSSTNLHKVQLNIDIVRYNDTLDKDESGQNEKQEEMLFNRFPPEEEYFLTAPSVVIDSGGRIMVWYMPGALTAMMMVGLLSTTSVFHVILSGCVNRTIFIVPHIP
jgi:hypothetical protein